MRSVQFDFFLSFFPVFFFFLIFLSVFSLTDIKNSQDGTGEGIIIFLVFHFQPLTNIHLVHRDFYHLFLLDLFVITRLMRLVLLRYLQFFCIFMDVIKSELLNLTFQNDIVRIWAHIKLSPFYYKVNTLTNWDLHPYPLLPICHTYQALSLAITNPLTVS